MDLEFELLNVHIFLVFFVSFLKQGKMDEKIIVTGISLESSNNHFDYQPFYLAPFCKIGPYVTTKSFFEETTYSNLAFNITKNENISHKQLCSFRLSEKSYTRLTSFSGNATWMHLMIKGINSRDLYSQIGYRKLNEENEFDYYVFTHFHFIFHNEFISSVELIATNPVKIRENMKLEYTYAVTWIQTTKETLNNVDEVFFHSSTRYLTLTGGFCMLGILYILSSSLQPKRPQLTCVNEFLGSLTMIGVNLLINLSLIFLNFTLYSHSQFSFMLIIRTSIISSTINAFIITKYMNKLISSNVNSLFIQVLSNPLIFFLYNILIDSYHFGTFFVSFFSLKKFIALALCHIPSIVPSLIHIHKTKPKSFFEREYAMISQNNQKTVIETLLISIFVGISTLTISLSEPYYIYSSIMQRKHFDSWVLPIASLIIMYFIIWLEMRVIVILYPHVKEIYLCCYSSFFSGVFFLVGFLTINKVHEIALIFGIIFGLCITILSFSASFFSLFK